MVLLTSEWEIKTTAMSELHTKIMQKWNNQRPIPIKITTDQITLDGNNQPPASSLQPPASISNYSANC